MKLVVVTGGNLFRVAAEELGDATQWIRLAQLNKISDPMLNGIVSLLIPPVNPTSGGGIAPQ